MADKVTISLIALTNLDKIANRMKSSFEKIQKSADQTGKKFGETQRRAARASMGIRRSFEQTGDRIAKRFPRAGKAVSGMSKGFGRLGARAVFAGARIASMAASIAAVVAPILGAVAAVTALAAGFIKLSSAKTKDLLNLDNLSKAYGVSIQAFQRWRYVVGQAGVDAQTADRSLASLQDSLRSASEGGAQQIRAFEQLGLNFQQLRDQSPEEAITSVFEAINRLKDDTSKLDLARDIFGGDAEALGRAFELTRGQIAAAQKEAEDFGLVSSDETIKNLREMEQAIGKAQGRISGAWNRAFGKFAPVISKAVERIANSVAGLLEDISASEGLQNLIIGTIQLATKAVSVISTAAQVLLVMYDQAVEGFATMIQWAIDLGVKIGELWNSAVEGVASFITGAIELFNTLRSAIFGVFERIRDFVSEIFDAILGRIMDRINSIKNAVQTVAGAPGRLWRAITGAEEEDDAQGQPGRATGELDRLLESGRIDSQRRIQLDANFRVDAEGRWTAERMRSDASELNAKMNLGMLPAY